MENAGLRKIVSALILVVVAVVTTLLKGDIPPHLATFLEFTFGALVVGNGVEHVTGMLKSKQGTEYSLEPVKEQAADGNLQMNQKLVDLDQKMVQLATNTGLIQETLIAIIKKTGLDK